MGESLKPDFICIGATKAGTSWLYDRLSELPEFRMPLHKEIGYFDRDSGWTYTKSPLQERSLAKRLLDIRKTRKAIYNVIRRGISDPTSFKFWFHWYFSDYDDKWYKQLFSKDYISGDITPSYSLLEKEDIKKIRNVKPDVKIIYLIRNPIERAWSQYRMMNPENKSDEDIIKYLKNIDSTKRGDYRNNLKRYLSLFDPRSVLICFYDAIADQPTQLLKDICEFLDSNQSDIESFCNVDLKSNVSRTAKIPNKVKQFLIDYYKEDITYYANNFGSYALKWHQEYYNKKDSHNIFKTCFKASEINNI